MSRIDHTFTTLTLAPKFSTLATLAAAWADTHERYVAAFSIEGDHAFERVMIQLPGVPISETPSLTTTYGILHPLLGVTVLCLTLSVFLYYLRNTAQNVGKIPLSVKSPTTVPKNLEVRVLPVSFRSKLALNLTDSLPDTTG
jgi:hypothetical protein